MQAYAVQRKRESSGIPALKADGCSAFLGAFAPDGGHVLQLATDLTGAAHRGGASDVAESGFSGPAGALPYRTEMERSFGTDFSDVKVHTGSVARKANDSLGARAYTMGNQIAFKEDNPSKSLVAHELTHVVQQTSAPAMKSDGGGIDTSGEAQAEAVEAAVASGGSAREALGASSIGHSIRGPARKGRGRPARAGSGDASRFAMGMQFSKEAFEKSYEYTIWNKSMSWPTPVPGVNFMLDPSVKVAGKLGAGYGGEKKGKLSVGLEVSGDIGIGLSGGIPNVAEVYATLNPGVSGSAQFEAGGQGGGWSLDVGITLKIAGKIGVKVGGGVLDFAYQFMELELLKLTGLYWDQTGFKKDKIGLHPGKDLEPIWNTIKKGLEYAKKAGAAIANGVKAAKKVVVSSAKAFWDTVTSW